MANRFEEAIAHFLAARQQPPGQWESLDEATVMAYLVVRHVEGLVELARRDEVLLAPAWACARSAMEVAPRLRWLLEPDDAYSREGRWLARIEEEERFHRATASGLADVGGEAAQIERVADQVRDFRIRVADLLPARTLVPRSIPSADSAIAHDPGVYLLYRQASQYVHGTHAGGSLYRRHLGTAKQLGERIRTSMWAGPLQAGWWGLTTAGTAVLDAIGGALWPQKSLVQAVMAALETLARCDAGTTDT